MHRILASIALVSLGLLTACGSVDEMSVVNSAGRQVGKIIPVDVREASFVSMENADRGHVRGNIVRDAGGKRLGTVTERDGKVVITASSGNDIGTLETGNICLGKGPEPLGTITGDVDSSIAAAGCLVFFLRD